MTSRLNSNKPRFKLSPGGRVLTAFICTLLLYGWSTRNGGAIDQMTAGALLALMGTLARDLLTKEEKNA